MHLILTGATGLIGSAVLDAMLKTDQITRISIISRRPVQMAEDRNDPRVRVLLHNDFTKYDDALLQQIKGADGCVWALGVSQSAVGKAEYIKVTKDYTVAAAEAFLKIPPADPSTTAGSSDDDKKKEPFRFVFVSGHGATLTPGFFTPLFGRVKGETERLLADLQAKHQAGGASGSGRPFVAHSVRPAGVDPIGHEAILPYVPRVNFALGATRTVLAPVVRTVMRDLWTPTQMLGRFCTDVAMGRYDGKLTGDGIAKLGDFALIENTAIQKLAGLDTKL